MEDKEKSQQIHELQVIERNSQMLLMQKQSFALEINETETALEELKKSSEEVYKLSGSIFIKADKNNVLKELEEKDKILNLRLKSVEKQEELLESRAEQIKDKFRQKQA